MPTEAEAEASSGQSSPTAPVGEAATQTWTAWLASWFGGGSAADGMTEAGEAANSANDDRRAVLQNPAIKDITVYIYTPCPFCNKLMAFLDFAKLPYKAVEVGGGWPVCVIPQSDPDSNPQPPITVTRFRPRPSAQVDPLRKKEIAFSEYKKVPIAVVDGEQLNDSSEIITRLRTRLGPEQAARLAAPSSEEERWRAWVDDDLVHVMTSNIYRTWGESLQAFDYLLTAGNFGFFQKHTARYTGAAAMYVLFKFKLNKKYGITEPRPQLYASVERWVREGLDGRDFNGGSKPNLADLAVFGVLRAIENGEYPTFADVMANTSIRAWYARMTDVVGPSCCMVNAAHNY